MRHWPFFRAFQCRTQIYRILKIKAPNTEIPAIARLYSCQIFSVAAYAAYAALNSIKEL
jgi:hypothetical protein